MNNYYVYIITNRIYGVLYTGVSNDLVRRIGQHKSKMIEGFSKKYNLTKLVYYEQTQSVESAIVHEKNIKEWKRAWKIALIEKSNPEWKDLYDGIL